ncbi:serine/arginine repetitive matrix protein 1-like [Penaeus japonicus]|uniref:serine/arginine repetitive matrix protein 1-like n=1 Tax=Penaeus japonicus TaxID=27405 RepID=UPI001C71668F|nr:serine/arginine repetitive matrix protein 1-like [Penaeus japonicus]
MMASCRPRRHSVVTLRLTVTPDDELDLCRSAAATSTPSPSPTLPPRPRSHSRQRYSQGRQPPASPLRRTPTSPLPRTPPPLTRTPTSPMSRTPTSPLCREPPSPNARSTPSPVSPRSVGGRHFRYDMWADQRGLRRRSSLLTVPSTHDPPSDLHLRLPRQRSSSIAGPLRPPDLVRYLSESVQRHRLDDGGSGDVSICSSFDESEQEQDLAATSPQYDAFAASEGGASHSQDPSGGGRTTPSAPAGVRSGHVSPGSFAGYPTPDPFAADTGRRRNSSADPTTESRSYDQWLLVLLVAQEIKAWFNRDVKHLLEERHKTVSGLASEISWDEASADPIGTSGLKLKLYERGNIGSKNCSPQEIKAWFNRDVKHLLEERHKTVLVCLRGQLFNRDLNSIKGWTGEAPVILCCLFPVGCHCRINLQLVVVKVKVDAVEEIWLREHRLRIRGQ